MNLSFKSVLEELLNEKWTNKYKRSIDCKNPKGFSQKAHCDARKKRKKGLKTKSKSPFNESILSEASKVDILKTKLGLSDKAANKINDICGPLSVWMTNKIKDLVKAQLQSWGTEKPTPESINDYTNRSIEQGQFNQSLTSIMDYIRVGLNGNISTLKSLGFGDIFEASKNWHDSLETGQGDINYVEEDEIIKDFRNKDGEGFYWVDLATNDSKEECERMGHCGRTAKGNNLYSLREVKKLPGGKYTLNKSHLTASIGDDGTLYQLKGPKNSKPKDEFHQYILPLFYVLGGGGEQEDYLIQGFGSEYDSSRDFKISDLPNSTIKDLYENRPELFESRSLKRLLDKMGIIELPKIDMTFTLDLEPHQVGDYVEGDFTVRQRKNKDGRVIKTSLFETILAGETWDLWEGSNDWESALRYHVNSNQEQKIENILRKFAEEKGVEFDEDLSLESQIEEYDEDWEVRDALSSSMSDAESNAYSDYLWNALKDALEELGTVLKMDDTGVILQIDLSNLIKGIDENYLDEVFEGCDDDIKCVFNELDYYNEISKPEIDLDDSPDVDENSFNEYLSDRLSDIS